MRPIKAILKSATFRKAACWLGALYIRLVYSTGSWQIIKGHIPEKYWNEGKPFILAFWHGRLLMMPYCWRRNKPIHMLISSHRDGQLIARTVGHFGIHTVEGSSSKGGAKAFRNMVKALAKNEYVGITPDGPRGPRMQASSGIVSVARLSGAPVIPAAFGIDKGRVLGTWDGFLVAKPFARGVIVWGDPVHVARDGDQQAQEQARINIEQGLNDVTREADILSGRPPVEPAPLTSTDNPS